MGGGQLSYIIFYDHGVYISLLAIVVAIVNK